MPHDYLKLLRPNPGQTALLKAALLHGNEARSAHLKWRKGVVLDDIDRASHRLLPLLAENLGRLEIEDPDMPRLRGIRRRQLYHNRMLLHAVQPILVRLTEVGIPHLLLKGAAICATVRQDWSLRYLSDIDILVPARFAFEAWAELDRLGWRDAGGLQEPSDRRRMLDSIHSIGFRNLGGAEVDLHWRALAQLEYADQEAAFWRDSVSTSAGGIESRALSLEHLLFHVLAHGVLGARGESMDWIPDAHAILMKVPRDHEWNDLLGFARQRSIAHILCAQLSWMRDELGAPVPEKLLARLAASPVSWAEKTLAWGKLDRFAGVWMIRSRWHDREGEPVLRRVTTIWNDLARFYGAPAPLLPLYAGLRAARRATKAFRSQRAVRPQPGKPVPPSL